MEQVPQIEDEERRVWDALVAGDRAADAALLHPEFLGVYPDGFADATAHAGQLAQGPSVASYTLEAVRTRTLGPDHALISYRARFRRSGQEAEDVMFVSSIWERGRAGWINVFSQDTPATSFEKTERNLK